MKNSKKDMPTENQDGPLNEFLASSKKKNLIGHIATVHKIYSGGNFLSIYIDELGLEKMVLKSSSSRSIKMGDQVTIVGRKFKTYVVQK